MAEILQSTVTRGIKTDLILDGEDLHVHRSYIKGVQQKINEYRQEWRDESKKKWYGNQDHVPIFRLDELEAAYIRKHYGDDILHDVPELIKIIEKHFPHAKVFHGSLI